MNKVLTKEERDVVLAFLERVNMKATEAPLFMQVLQALRNMPTQEDFDKLNTEYEHEETIN